MRDCVLQKLPLRLLDFLFYLLLSQLLIQNDVSVVTYIDYYSILTLTVILKLYIQSHILLTRSLDSNPCGTMGAAIGFNFVNLFFTYCLLLLAAIDELFDNIVPSD